MQHLSPRKILPLLTLFAISFFVCAHAHAQTQAHEVTASEYADFLNQNAASDPDHLFDEKMGSDPESACIIRFGTPEKCHYEVIAGRESFPVPYINEARAAAYAAAMNLEQESHHQDFFLASNQNSFSFAINNPLAELSLRIPNLSSDSHYLESGSTMAIIGTLGMIVMGMVGREEPVHEPVEASSRNTIAFETAPHYGGRMDNVRPAAGNTPPIITEIGHQLPASERTTGSFEGHSVTEARGLTDTERAALINSPASASKPIYRLGEGGWEEQTPNGSWEQTDRFKRDDLGQEVWKTAGNFSQEDANILEDVTERFIDNYSGLERINQKRNRLLHELAEEKKQPSPNEQKCEFLLKRIRLLEEANEELIKKLAYPPATSISEQISNSIDRLHRAEKTSDKDYNHFELAELSLDCRQQSINRDNPKDSVRVTHIVKEPRRSFNKAAREAKKDNHNQQVIRWLILSAELSQQALTAIDAGQGIKANHLYSAAFYFIEAAEQAQEDHPNQEMIDGSIRRAESYQKLATADDAG